MSYLEHYGLEREPFSNAPDARFYYNSDQHSQALLRLMYAVDSNKGLAVLVGGVGTGKTTLARRMLDNLPEERYESSLLVMVHSGITPEWILTRIAMQLGVEAPAGDRLKLLKQLYTRLLEIDDVKVLAQFPAHVGNRVDRRARYMWNVQTDQTRHALWCKQGHLPGEHCAPVVADDYRTFDR